MKADSISGVHCDTPGGPLQAAVEYAAHLLPGQGPIGVFVHHNPLHAFEQEPFEQAVVQAGSLFGCEPFLAEDRYRAHLREGRVRPQDLDAVLEAELGEAAGEVLAPGVKRAELCRQLLIHGINEASGIQLGWLLSETPVLGRFRLERSVAVHAPGPETSTDAEAQLVRALWGACQRAVGRSTHEPPTRHRVQPQRHRDFMKAAFDVDIDDWIEPLLIRFVSAFLDQGLAHWPMPERDRGMLACFVDLYGSRWASLCGPWGRELVRLLRQEQVHGPDPYESLRRSLAALGVAEGEWEAFLAAEAHALPGWAGMVRQAEERPDRLPGRVVPARLVDFLAVRLLLSRAVLTFACHDVGLRVPLTELRDQLARRLPRPGDPSATDRAWVLFNAAQLCRLTAADLDALSCTQVAVLEEELARFDSIARRRLLHRAYERRLRHHFLDVIAQHPRSTAPESPAYQAVFCIDDREESMRRHLEEVDPSVETFGTAGFYGVAMYYRSATDAHARPLCPAPVTPRHYVGEVRDEPRGRARWQRIQRRLLGLVDKNLHVGSRTLSRGAVIMAALGTLWVLPLMLRVLFPWSRRGLAHANDLLFREGSSRLLLERVDDAPPMGEYSGFSIEEMAEIVRAQLSQIGVVGRLSPLVLFLGHGSSSLNNPQKSAYDCGACGGGQGGANARALAQMANHPEVRARLAGRGIPIPSDTWFVGGQRNTANNDILFYDEELVPERTRGLLSRAKRAFDSARQREAHERCRRFASASTSLSPRASLMHVQTRAVDLAQPRPECGHATNAFCVVGRRSRTRGLFLDRRAFLTSYDSSVDPGGEILKQLLAAVVPVVAGINLEYFFGYVDPTGYGCGTKLPHNIASLLGVMDGAQSDLRTGLSWQMLEIHEPVRLTLVVESRLDVLLRLLAQDAYLQRLVHNGWLALACLSDEDQTLTEIGPDGAHRYSPEDPLKRVHGASVEHYRGLRGHLAFVSLDGAPKANGAAA